MVHSHGCGWLALLIVVTFWPAQPSIPCWQACWAAGVPSMPRAARQSISPTTRARQMCLPRADKYNEKIAEEGFVLLKNKGGALPVYTPESERNAAAEQPKVSVFGKNSVNLAYGGSGSGGGGRSLRKDAVRQPARGGISDQSRAGKVL